MTKLLIPYSFQDDAELRGQRRLCMVEAGHTGHSRIALEEASNWTGSRRNSPA